MSVKDFCDRRRVLKNSGHISPVGTISYLAQLAMQLAVQTGSWEHQGTISLYS